MEHKIVENIKGLETKIVVKKDTAIALGSGLSEVFATPAMVALMENAAYKSIQEYLPNGYSSVGIEINVKHLKASLPGAIISCSSVVTRVDGNKIFFNIEAADNDGLIGTAEHTRFIVDSQKFLDRLKK